MIRNHQKLLRIVLSVFNDKSNGLKQKSWDKNGRYFCPPLSSARLNLAQQDWWENHTGDYRCPAHARVLQTSFRECVTVSSAAAAKSAKKENIQKWQGALACRRDWRDDSEISICWFSWQQVLLVLSIFGWKCDGKVECVFLQQLEKKNLGYFTVLETCPPSYTLAWLWWFKN